MTIAVVTDSAASLPPELVARYDITVVPMYLTLGGDSWREGEQAFDVLETENLSTAGPNAADFAAAIEPATRQADGVVVLTIAATMSSTFDAANLGARSFDRPVRVIDTKTAAGAEGLVAIAAARAARAGGSLDDTVRAAEAAIASVHLVATVPTLDHLVRGGRVPNLAGLASRWLGISPIFEFRDAAARPLRPALSEEAAHHRIVAALVRDRRPEARLEVAALHSRAESTAQALLTAVEDEVGSPELSFVASFGAVMEVHIGPGLVGLAWRWSD